jgi:hypothetical protein
VKKIVFLLLVMAVPACSGDSTGSRPSLAGQWIYRMRATSVDNVFCYVVGSVRLTGSGDSFSGRMPVAEASCSSDNQSFDSTTTLTARVEGDSVLLTLRAGVHEFRQTARLLGDSLAGRQPGDPFGKSAARRYPDSVPLDRANVHLTGAVTRTVELYGRDASNGLQLISVARDEVVFLRPPSSSLPGFAVGTYAVGSSGAPLFGTYERFSGGMVDPYVRFTGGTVTITQADAQLVRGTIDVTGVLNEGTEQVRLQADFTSHRSGYPD